VASVFAYFSLLNRFLKLKEKREENFQKEFENILKDTQFKMQKIVDETYGKSRQIISSAELFAEKQNKVLEEELTRSTHVYLEMYQKTINNLEANIEKTTSSIPDQIKEVFVAKLSTVSEQFSNNLIKITEEFKKSIDIAYKNIELQIQSYRDERYKQIDRSMVEIIQQIAKKVLMKQINAEEHEKIVTKALEDAKRTGIFTGED
jgi:F0F1-type ATP synthase membrane subunit b/b'